MNLSETSATQGDLFDLSGLTSHTPPVNSSTFTSCFSGIGNAQPYTLTGGTGTTGSTITTTVGPTTTYTFPNTMVYPAPQIQPAGQMTVGAFELTTKVDDDGKDTLVLSLGDRKKCMYKCQLLPGIFLYTNHGRPGFFHRLVLRVLFGMKWENTLAERFIEAL